MQKVTAFLEQHVQWIAIGLGALFCLYMAYSYVIIPPAEVTIGNDTFGPSEIDPHTAETAAAKLQSAMQSSGRIKMEVPQYVQAFQDAMTWKNAQPVQIAGLIDPALTQDVTVPPPPQQLGPDGRPIQPPLAQNQNGVTPPPPPAGAIKVTELPVPPKPLYGDVRYGR